MRVFFSEPDGSTWIEDLPYTCCISEIKTSMVALAMVKYRAFTAPPGVERRYKFKGMSLVEGKSVMFYDRIEEP